MLHLVGLGIPEVREAVRGILLQVNPLEEVDLESMLDSGNYELLMSDPVTAGNMMKGIANKGQNLTAPATWKHVLQLGQLFESLTVRIPEDAPEPAPKTEFEPFDFDSAPSFEEVLRELHAELGGRPFSSKLLLR